jgi:NAD(P)H-hydrate epimerase
MTRNSNIEFIPTGVSEEFVASTGIAFDLMTHDYIAQLMQPRKRDAHKGTYGHALLVCGSKGMSGAAVLSTGAALRSGCGLVTTHIPESERFALTANYPSGMLSLDGKDFFSTLPQSLERYSAFGVGPGLGLRRETIEVLEKLMRYASAHKIPMVVDADALNIMVSNPEVRIVLPQGTILTPHLGELRRLVGDWRDEEHKIRLVRDFSSSLGTIVVVKGPDTMICVRGRRLSFNSTGNSGMAKAGSGDVLTGLITGLLARGYDAETAAEIGVYIHGLAGDKARDFYGAEGMNSADMIDFLAEAMLEFQ